VKTHTIRQWSPPWLWPLFRLPPEPVLVSCYEDDVSWNLLRYFKIFSLLLCKKRHVELFQIPTWTTGGQTKHYKGRNWFLPPRCLICHTRRNEYFLWGNCGIKLSTTVDLDELARPMRDMICSMTNLWDELH
jgi:hypothetical protein